MSNLVEKLEAVSSQIESIFADGKVTILEVFSTLETLSNVVKETIAELPAKPTIEEIQKMLNDAWQWGDGKYKLIEKADAAVKLPFLFEALDGMLFRYLVENVLIPQAANKLGA